jgi:caffeoyl-CoA O-methyltransferase
LREPDVARRLREETARLPQHEMLLMPEEAQFLSVAARMVSARRTLEVGVFTGYSSLIVALALPDDARIVACDISEEFTSIAKRYWEEAGVRHKIDLKLGPALETLRALIADGQAGAFDFAFIDADKTNYANYYELALQLLRPGGTIVTDNVLWAGKVADSAVDDADTRALRAFNEKLHADERVSLSLLPLGDGLSLAYKR